MDIIKVNERLSKGNCRLKVALKGNSLYLRGTFPPKTGEVLPKQRYLSLGVKLTAEGLKFAEAKAKELSGKLDLNRFRWDEFEKKEDKSLDSLIQSLKKDYFKDKEQNSTTLSTWKHEYLQPFLKLSRVPITIDALIDALIDETLPNTRNRRRHALAYAKLADYAGLDGSQLRAMVGDYGLKSLSPRSLPSDSEIQDLYLKLPKLWVKDCFALMTVWGLRNHECFHADLDDWPVCFVARGKTNERYCWPLFPEWAEWLPEIDLKHREGLRNSQLGNMITKAFKTNNIPFTPYNLRHCWAVRSILFGLDISLAAAQMGHSVTVHSKIYHHWITKEIHQKAYDLILKNPNRPLPPS